MTMPSASTPLREAVKKRFYPLMVKRGFSREKSRNPLFVTFRRELAGEVHEFNIQWDKYWRPFFVINFGHGAVGDDVIPMAGRLQRTRGGGLGVWFNLKRPWRDRIRTLQWTYTPDEVVDELVDAFEELERWWRDGAEGKHLHLWRPSV